MSVRHLISAVTQAKPLGANLGPLITMKYQNAEDGECVSEKHGIDDYQQLITPHPVFKNQSDCNRDDDQIAD